MKSKRSCHKEVEASNEQITHTTQYGEQQSEKQHMEFWDLYVYTLKMKKVFWEYLLARRKSYLDTTVIYAAAQK